MPEEAVSLKQPCDPVISALRRLLAEHSAERVIVVGTTCTGKSTLLAQIAGARDQDSEVFPTLSKAEADYVCREPWTEEIGRTMDKLVRERVKAKAGQPVFGTVVIDADFIVLLKISDELLQERTAKRKSSFDSAKAMQRRLEQEVLTSGISCIEFFVG
jgi:ATPase subunit of ABC transporter with duplicated ATPase domains